MKTVRSAGRNGFTLSRRALLRGMGLGGAVTVGLPLLEAMLDRNGEALADGERLPTRFVTWFFGNGVVPELFEPEQAGADWELSPELAPLAAVKEYVSVVTGMMNRCPPQDYLTHHEGMIAFSGYRNANIGEGPGFFSNCGGPTIDQVIADRIAEGTSTHSVQMGVAKTLSDADFGTTMKNLSHRGPDQPLSPRFNPQDVWQRLFGEFVPKPDDKALRLSVLDAVRDDAARLRERLGAGDRARLDAHLDGVRQLEEKIVATPPACVLPDMPEEKNDTDDRANTRVNEVMSDLLVHAFKCDVTRVASMLFLGGAAVTTITDLRHTTSHHEHTHSAPPQIVHEGVVWIMQRFAYLLEAMKNEVDARGENLLDTSIVYASSDCYTGWDHSVERQPAILVGHGRNKLVFPGIHLQASPFGQGATGNLTDVLMTLARCYDPTIPSIGADVTGSSTILPALTGSSFEG